MRVGYCRVSTTKSEQDISIEGQRQQLLAAGCDEIVSERASAYKGQRKGWTRLWALVASGKVTEVLVVDQSRLSRSGDDIEFLQACALKQVKVRALTGGEIEVESVGGFITSSVMSVMNEAYSRLNSAKVKDGLARRRAAGHYAVGYCPFGYRYHQGTVEPDPEQWDEARQRWEQLMAMEMNTNGYVRLNPGVSVSSSGLKNWVRNPMLRGIVPHQKNGVKPLVSPDEWEQAKRLLSRRTRRRVATGVRQTHLFSSLIACACCGRSLHRHVTGYHRVRWKCSFAPCDWYGRSIKELLVRTQAVEALRKESPRMAREARQANNAKAKQKPLVQVEAESKLAQLLALQESGVLELETSIETLRNQIAALAAPVVGPDWEGLTELIAGGLDTASDEELRVIFLEFFERIVFEGNPKTVGFELRGAAGGNTKDGCR
tara:strand:+ start:3204 stop:4499 length:1296 start_codon:yes stop_codon:yes gene_type:complete